MKLESNFEWNYVVSDHHAPRMAVPMALSLQ